MRPIDPTGPAKPIGEAALDAQRAKLRKAAHQLEGVFLAQLFQAMRATVPQAEGETSEGQAMFTSMLDDEFASRAADQLHRGLGEALYRQLSRRLSETQE
jgi:Rod binding domain-containing protein